MRQTIYEHVMADGILGLMQEAIFKQISSYFFSLYPWFLLILLQIFVSIFTVHKLFAQRNETYILHLKNMNILYLLINVYVYLTVCRFHCRWSCSSSYRLFLVEPLQFLGMCQSIFTWQTPTLIKCLGCVTYAMLWDSSLSTLDRYLRTFAASEVDFSYFFSLQNVAAWSLMCHKLTWQVRSKCDNGHVTIISKCHVTAYKHSQLSEPSQQFQFFIVAWHCHLIGSGLAWWMMTRYGICHDMFMARLCPSYNKLFILTVTTG